LCSGPYFFCIGLQTSPNKIFNVQSLTRYFMLTGTGKTETTKDLARALGIPCYVFNCSDQMDYRSMGQIFKGLSQAGAWGCFGISNNFFFINVKSVTILCCRADEFNRIDISVLSVVSTQWKCILDAIRGRKARFIFEEEDIVLNHEPFCSAYITVRILYFESFRLLDILTLCLILSIPDESWLCWSYRASRKCESTVSSMCNDNP
jgi:hypothetical protein